MTWTTVGTMMSLGPSTILYSWYVRHLATSAAHWRRGKGGGGGSERASAGGGAPVTLRPFPRSPQGLGALAWPAHWTTLNCTGYMAEPVLLSRVATVYILLRSAPGTVLSTVLQYQY